ncbi:MAG: radical SAM protein [Thermoplasmata archaeon]
MSFRRILLIKPSGRHGISFAFDMIPTGLEYIAAHIEDVVDEINIVDLEMEPKPIQRAAAGLLDSLKPDLVGISMSSTEHTEGLELAQMAKKRGAMTVLGGYHPTAIPDELLSHPQVDFIVRGEGEQKFKELVTKGDPKGIKGISYRDGNEIIHNPERDFIEDLDSLSFPARHLRRYKYYLSMARGKEHDIITTSRGCWGRCSFCCEPTMSHSHQRYRSPENVMAEILEIVKYHDRKPLSIEITDPHFMGKPELVERLCDLLASHKLDIGFTAKVRPDSMAKHPEVVRKMIAVGIAHFEMGIESPNMRDLGNTSKGVSPDIHITAVNNIKKWGGSAGGTFVIGLPDQTEEEILEFPAYAKKLGIVGSAFGIATPYPGTKFYEELDTKGLIFETDWNRFDEMHSVYNLKHISSERIEELASICMAKFWTVDTFFERERLRIIRENNMWSMNAEAPIKEGDNQFMDKRLTLMEFIRERRVDIKFSLSAGTQLQGENFNKHMQQFFEVSPDPSVMRYTEKVGIHNLIKMSRFLDLLGPQTTQITMRSDGKPLVSWVIKTTKNTVEHIQVIPGKMDGATINFDAELNDFKINGQQRSSRINNVRLVAKLLASNKGIKNQLGLCRLIAAAGIEFTTYLGTKNNGNSE